MKNQLAAARLHRGDPGGVGDLPGVVGPLHRLALQAGPVSPPRRAGVEMHLVLLAGRDADRQRDGAVVAVGDHVHPVAVEPLPGDAERRGPACSGGRPQDLHRHARCRGHRLVHGKLGAERRCWRRRCRNTGPTGRSARRCGSEPVGRGRRGRRPSRQRWFAAISGVRSPWRVVLQDCRRPHHRRPPWARTSCPAALADAPAARVLIMAS